MLLFFLKLLFDSNNEVMRGEEKKEMIYGVIRSDGRGVPKFII